MNHAPPLAPTESFRFRSGLALDATVATWQERLGCAFDPKSALDLCLPSLPGADLQSGPGWDRPVVRNAPAARVAAYRCPGDVFEARIGSELGLAEAPTVVRFEALRFEIVERKLLSFDLAPGLEDLRLGPLLEAILSGVARTFLFPSGCLASTTPTPAGLARPGFPGLE